MWVRESSLVLRCSMSAATAPDCNPFLVFPLLLGWVRVPALAAAASIYSSAILAASLKMATNIGRVSFPVWVFWLEGW